MHSLTSASFIICLWGETFGSRTILFGQVNPAWLRTCHSFPDSDTSCRAYTAFYPWSQKYTVISISRYRFLALNLDLNPYNHSHFDNPIFFCMIYKPGPEFWSTLEGGELCDGDRQSPIDIHTDDTVEQEFEPWTLQGYDNEGTDGPHLTILLNNGHTCKRSE